MPPADIDAMPIKTTSLIHEKVLHVRVGGRLTDADYQQFVPEVERLIERHGTLRLLVELSDFHGWHAGALWDDFKIYLKHGNEIERLAIVGEKAWQEWMTRLAKPFLRAEVRYFDQVQAGDARRWVLEECVATKA
jgi:hypothetical protein